MHIGGGSSVSGGGENKNCGSIPNPTKAFSSENCGNIPNPTKAFLSEHCGGIPNHTKAFMSENCGSIPKPCQSLSSRVSLSETVNTLFTEIVENWIH